MLCFAWSHAEVMRGPRAPTIGMDALPGNTKVMLTEPPWSYRLTFGRVVGAQPGSRWVTAVDVCPSRPVGVPQDPEVGSPTGDRAMRFPRRAVSYAGSAANNRDSQRSVGAD